MKWSLLHFIVIDMILVFWITPRTYSLDLSQFLFMVYLVQLIEPILRIPNLRCCKVFYCFNITRYIGIFGFIVQVLNHYVTIITNAGSSIILVYSVIDKQLFFTKKARIESNWKTKHTYIFVLIILRAALVMIVTYRWFETWYCDINLKLYLVKIL